MYLCLIITIDCERSTLLATVNTFRACVYFAGIVGKLSYLVIVLMRHMVVIIQFYFLILDLIPRWLFVIGDRYSHHISNLLIQSCSWINKYIYTLWQHTNTYTQFRKKYRYKHTYK